MWILIIERIFRFWENEIYFLEIEIIYFLLKFYKLS